MKKRSKSQWQQLVSEHANSGMSTASFAAKHSMSATYFSTKRQQLLRAGFVPATSAFVQLQRSAPVLAASGIRLRHGGCEIVLDATTDPVWLAGLVRALA